MWIVIAVVAVVVVGSILAGEGDNASSGGSGGVDQNSQKCEGCKKAKAWYNSLPNWKKGLYTFWYAYKKIQCNLSGCSF